jgi:L-iditol 2-dehydrogenase
MKSVLFLRKGKSIITEVEDPKIDDDEILLKINSCAICGTDIKLEEGISTKFDKYGNERKMQYPRITGHELSGTVIEVGKNISKYKVNDRLNVTPNLPCGKCYYCQIGNQNICDYEKDISYDYDGAFAEYMVIPKRAITLDAINKISETVTFEEAALTEPVALSINSQQVSNVSLGDVVLILGLGPLGCIAIQLARINGAKKIIAVQRSKERFEFAKRFGADVYINTIEEDLVDRVLEETEGLGVDKIIVCCSSSDLQEKSLYIIKKRGVINFFASLPKDNPFIKINSNLIHYKEIIITGTYNSTPLQNKLAYNLIERRKINVKDLITHKFSLDDYYKAIDTAKKGEGMQVVINIR